MAADTAFAEALSEVNTAVASLTLEDAMLLLDIAKET